MYSILRAKSLGTSQSHAPSKKTKLSSSTELVEHGVDESDVMIIEERTLFFQLTDAMDIMSNTWGIAGCFDVVFKTETYKYCHWQDAIDYMDDMKEHMIPLLSRFTEASVVSYTTRVEERFRATAVKYARADHVSDDEKEPWGMCLLRAMRTESRFWQEHKEMLMPLSRGMSGTSTPQERIKTTPATPRVPDTPHKTTDTNNAISRKDWATEATTKDGKTICKWFNDQRGCDKVCPKGMANVCDVSVNGRACGAASHSRKTHDPDKHGRPRTKKV